MTIKSRFRKYINTALIMLPMTMIMAFVGVMRNYGLHPGWIVKHLKTWGTMFPVAYFFAFFIIPIANKITAKIRFSE